MDPITEKIMADFADPVTTYERRKFEEFLKQQDTKDLATILKNWYWRAYETQRQMIRDELDRRMDEEDRRERQSAIKPALDGRPKVGPALTSTVNHLAERPRDVEEPKPQPEEPPSLRFW